MPGGGHIHADTASQKRTIRTATDNLLLFTTISALDGTILMLAAAGTFEDPWTAILAGLTVVAGAGAWLSARNAFSSRLRRDDWLRLLRVAVPAVAATFAAALLGSHLGDLRLSIIPKAAGLALLLIAIEVGIRPLPRPRKVAVPIPLTLIALAIPLEVLNHWTP